MLTDDRSSKNMVWTDEESHLFLSLYEKVLLRVAFVVRVRVETDSEVHADEEQGPSAKS